MDFVEKIDEIDRKILQIWEKHPTRMVIGGTEHFFEKAEAIKNFVEKELKNIDPLSITPLEALNILYKLKEEVKTEKEKARSEKKKNLLVKEKKKEL